MLYGKERHSVSGIPFNKAAGYINLHPAIEIRQKDRKAGLPAVFVKSYLRHRSGIRRSQPQTGAVPQKGHIKLVRAQHRFLRTVSRPSLVFRSKKTVGLRHETEPRKIPHPRTRLVCKPDSFQTFILRMVPPSAPRAARLRSKRREGVRQCGERKRVAQRKAAVRSRSLPNIDKIEQTHTAFTFSKGNTG